MLTEPPAPQNLTVSVIQNNASNGEQELAVNWAPVSPNANITSYTIVWWVDSASLSGRVRVPSENISYIIKNLTACTLVKVVVSASNRYSGINSSVEEAYTYVNRINLFIIHFYLIISNFDTTVLSVIRPINYGQSNKPYLCTV